MSDPSTTSPLLVTDEMNKFSNITRRDSNHDEHEGSTFNSTNNNTANHSLYDSTADLQQHEEVGVVHPASRSLSSSSSSNCFTLLTAALGGILFGYDTAIVNGGLFQMRKSFHFDLDSWENGLIVAIGVAGAFVGSAVGGWAGDKYGRKKTVVCADLLFILGSIVLAAAPSYAVVLVGRVVIGLGIGLSSVITPVFLAEITAPESRGQAVTLNNFALTGAQFLASIVAVVFVAAEPDDQANPWGWRAMFGLGALPALIQILLFQCLPESPRWLILSKKPKEEILQCVHELGLDPSFIDEQEAEMARLPDRSVVDLFTQPSLRRRLVVGCGLQFFQQFAGINTVLYYSSAILNHAGFSGDKDPVYFSAPLAFINALFTLVGYRYVERAGRRPLLIASLIGCLVSTVGFSIVGFASPTDPPPKSSSILFLCCLAAYLMAFAPGIGSVPWVVGSEIFPIDFRTSAASIATMTNWASNTVVSQAFPMLMGSIGLAWTFVIVSGFILAAVGFSWFFVPETRGLTLEEIGRQFPNGTDQEDDEGEEKA